MNRTGTAPSTFALILCAVVALAVWAISAAGIVSDNADTSAGRCSFTVSADAPWSDLAIDAAVSGAIPCTVYVTP